MAATATWKSRDLEVCIQKVDGEDVLEDQLVFEGLKQDGSLTGAFGITADLETVTDYSDNGLKVIDRYELTTA